MTTFSGGSLGLGRAVLELGVDGSKLQAEIQRDLKAAAGKINALGKDIKSAFSGVDDVFKGIGASASPLMDTLGGLATRITTFASGLSALGPIAGGVAVGLGAIVLASTAVVSIVGAVGLAIYKATTSAADYGDELFNLANKSGITVEALTELKFVGQQADVSLDAITGNIFKLGQKLSEGGDKAKAALKAMGTSLDEVRKLSPDEAFKKVIAGLHEIPDAGKRASAGVALFGKQYKEIAQLTEENMDAQIAKAHELGLVMSTEFAVAGDRFNDAIGAIGGEVTALTAKIGGAFLPVAIAFVETFGEELPKALAASGLQAGNFSDLIGGVAVQVGQSLAAIISLAAQGTKALVLFFTAGGLQTLAIVDYFGSVIGAIRETLKVASYIQPGLQPAIDLADAAAKRVHAFALTNATSIAATVAPILKAADAIDAAATVTAIKLPGAIAKVNAEITTAADRMRAAAAAAKGFGDGLGDTAAATKKADDAADKFNATQDKLLKTMRSAGIMTQQVVATGLAPFIEQLNLAAAAGDPQLAHTLDVLSPALFKFAAEIRAAGGDASIVTDLIEGLNRTLGRTPEAMAAWEQNIPRFGELMPMVKGYSVEAEIAATRTGTLADSFKALGITSQAELDKTAAEATRAYDTIVREIGAHAPLAVAAHRKMVEAINAATGKLDPFEFFGLKSREELQEIADKAREAYKQVVDEVGAASPLAIAAHQQMVDAINAASMTIPQRWKDALVPTLANIIKGVATDVDTALTGIVVGATKFGEGFLAVWTRLKTGVGEAASAMFQHVSGKFLQPLVKGLTDLFPQTLAVFEGITRAIGDAFGQMLTHARGFKDGFIAIWHDIKNGIAQILTSILQDFTGRFLKGLLGAMTGQQGAFSQAFSGLLSGGSGGTGSLTNNAGMIGKLFGAGGSAGMVGMGSTATMFGTNATAGAIAADPALAGSTATGFGGGAGGGLSAGLAGGAAAAGAGIIMGMIGKKIFGGAGWKASGFGAASGAATGALIGSVVPVLGTAVGAIIGGLAGAISGWIGKSAQMKVNDARDEIFKSPEFTQRFGTTGGTGEGSAFNNLAADLTKATGEAGGGHLFAAFEQAKTIQELKAAYEAIVQVLAEYDKKQKDAAASAADVAAKTGEVTAKLKEQTDAIHGQMDALTKELSDLDRSEKPEAHMGTIEKRARERIAKQQAELKAQLEDAEAAAKASIDAINTHAAEGATAVGTAANTGIMGGFDKAFTAADTRAGAFKGDLDNRFGDLDYTIKFRYETEGEPPTMPAPPSMPRHALGGLATRAHVGMIGEGRPELIADEPFLKRALTSALQASGMKSQGDVTINVTAPMGASPEWVRQAIRVAASEIGRGGEALRTIRDVVRLTGAKA